MQLHLARKRRIYRAFPQPLWHADASVLFSGKGDAADTIKAGIELTRSRLETILTKINTLGPMRGARERRRLIQLTDEQGRPARETGRNQEASLELPRATSASR